MHVQLRAEAWASDFEKYVPSSMQLCLSNYGLQRAVRNMNSFSDLLQTEVQLQ